MSLAAADQRTDAPPSAVSAGHATPSANAGPGRAQVLRALLVGLLLDVGLSAAAYGVARLLGADVFIALLAGAAVAGLRAAWVSWRHRTLDPFTLVVLATYVVSLVVALLSGSPRFLLAKESFATAAIGAAFVLTCLRGKPLAYYASQRVAAPTAGEREEWEQLWAVEPLFRRRFTTMSLVIGAALLAEAVARVIMVLTLPADVVVATSTLMLAAVLTAVSVWAVGYGQRTEQAVERSHRS